MIKEEGRNSMYMEEGFRRFLHQEEEEEALGFYKEAFTWRGLFCPMGKRVFEQKHAPTSFPSSSRSLIQI
ncbi:hypothetical protein Tco_0211619 [Tanacetum coccineum]